MKRSSFSRIFAVLAFAVAVTGSAFAHNFTVYRGLKGNVRKSPSPPCVNRALVNPGEFNVQGDGLSTWQAGFPLDTTKPYRLAFLVENAPNDPPQQDDTGTVNGINGQTYTATYTPQFGGTGHWSLNRPGADRADFSEYARANPNQISRNPSYAVPPNTDYCADAPTRTRLRKE